MKTRNQTQFQLAYLDAIPPPTVTPTTANIRPTMPTTTLVQAGPADGWGVIRMKNARLSSKITSAVNYRLRVFNTVYLVAQALKTAQPRQPAACTALIITFAMMGPVFFLAAIPMRNAKKQMEARLYASTLST